MLKALAPGDVVMVTRIDRLARSTFDLLGIVKRVVDAKAQFRSLAEPWADTGTSIGSLISTIRRATTAVSFSPASRAVNRRTFVIDERRQRPARVIDGVPAR
jgi:hypothetical protein